MHRRSKLLLSCVALALACEDVPSGVSPAAKDTGPVVHAVERIDLGTLGGASSHAADVNNDRTVVGSSELVNGVHHAFRWTQAEGMVDLGTLPGHDWSRAISITDEGRILGVSGTGTGYSGTPVVWSSSGEITPLSIPLLPGAQWGDPADLNEHGEVVGWDVVDAQHAWIWSESRGKYDITANVPEGSYEGVAGAINASGLVVGTNHAGVCVTDPSCWHAFVWSVDQGYRDLGTPVDDPDATLVGMNLNDAGTVVGWTKIPALGIQPYRWTDGQGFTLLRAGSYGYAMSINMRGTAVGAGWDAVHQAIQALAWPSTGETVKLSPGHPYPSVAAAINDAGDVAGWVSLNESGHVDRATLWILGGPSDAVKAQVAQEPASARPTVALLEVGGCLTDTAALVSRAALLACVATDGKTAILTKPH